MFLKSMSELLISIEFKSNLFSRYRALQMEIKQGDSRVTLVCGDNQQSLLRWGPNLSKENKFDIGR